MDELLKTAPCGFLSFNDDGGITLANRTVEEMLAYEPGTLPGTHFDRVLPVASRIFYQTHLFPLLKLHNRADEIYLTLRSKQGKDLPTLVNAVRRERDGTMANDCVIVQMKERSEYEDAILRAKKEAEAAMRTKDEFVAIVSHELRRPLASIIGWTQLLRSGEIGAEDTGQALAAVERGTLSMGRLIEDLMDHSRMIEGRLRINTERVDLGSLIRAALAVVAPAAAARSITIETELDNEVAPVSGDPERLQQVLWNLLSNAVKFTPKGGRVWVRIARVNSSVEISVRDNGAGITADFLPYVFDRFQQADDGGKRRRSGLGLGMTIAKQLVELHGGTIRADSPGQGQGATFTLRLPVMAVSEPVAVQNGDEGSAELPRLDGIRVLIVDDDEDARRILTSVLERNGAIVTAAKNAAEGLEAVHSRDLSVIISDVELPDLDGYSLMQEVRSLKGHTASQIPSIALTAHATASDRDRALAAGFQMHLAKPVGSAELVQTISDIVHHSSSRTA